MTPQGQIANEMADLRRVLKAARMGRTRAVFAGEPFQTEKRENPLGDPHCVYFLRAPDGTTKVGTTKNVESRIHTIRLCCPVPLTLVELVCGGVDLEQSLHERLARSRLHGEWFAPSTDLTAVLAEMAPQSILGKRPFEKPKRKRGFAAYAGPLRNAVLTPAPGQEVGRG